MKIIQLKGFRDKLENLKKMVIIGHRSPDGDAIGSTLGLKLYLEKLNIEAHVIVPNEHPDFLKWLPHNEEINIYENHTEHCDKLLDDAEMVFTLDFNDLNRVGEGFDEKLKNLQVEFTLIDHHQEPKDFAEYQFTDDEKCSTCELVYDLIKYYDDADKIDASIATNLYLGIMTDTGSFKYASTTADTHRAVADLIDHGAVNSKIHKKTFDASSVNRLQLLGVALSNLEKIEGLKVAFIHLSRQDLIHSGFKKGDTDGFVNYALSIKDVHMAAIFIEDRYEDYIKLSLRSKNDFDVNQFARKHFNGGGHINAAGGKFDRSLDEAISYFKDTLTQYPELKCKS